MTSQKTLPVSVTVIGFLGAVGEEGLMTIPCIVAHMSQLFIDAYIASRWANDVAPGAVGHGANGGGAVMAVASGASGGGAIGGGLEVKNGEAVQQAAV